MSWLDRIDEREARRLARTVGKRAQATGRLARDHLGAFIREAADVADDTIQPQKLMATVGSNARATRDLAREHLGAFAHDARATRDLAREHFGAFAHDAGALAGDTAQQLAHYGRQEGAIIAAAAAKQASRAGRAVKSDPVPYIVGAVGLFLLANLVTSRRASRR